MLSLGYYDENNMPVQLTASIFYVSDPDTGTPKDTHLTLMDADGNVVAEGHAALHWRDKFNRRTGRKVAFAHALAQLPQLSKAQREMLWNSFLYQVKI